MGSTTAKKLKCLALALTLAAFFAADFAAAQCLTVKKDTLKTKTYAFGAILQNTNLPTLPGMPFEIKGIYLMQNGKKIYFMDARMGRGELNISEPEPIVGEFPITSETADQITIDLSQGNWSFIISLGRVAINTTNILSYVDNFEMSEGAVSFSLNTAHITPTFFADYRGEETNEIYLQLRFFLKDYVSDPTFERRVNIPTKIGYFQTGPALVPAIGEIAPVISRRNINKQITYYISPTVPQPFRQAVKEGVEEWNKALGENALIVLDGDDNKPFYDARFNVIHWIADPAYAPAVAYGPSLAMPDSGEIIDGDVIVCGGSFLISAINYYKQRMAAYQQQLAQPRLLPSTPNAPWEHELINYTELLSVKRTRKLLPVRISINGWASSNEMIDDFSKDGIDRLRCDVTRKCS